MFLQYNTHFDAVCSDYFLVSDGEENFDRRFAINDFIACGIFYRKEVLFDLGLYNEEFKFREGHELNERFEKNGYLKGFSGFPLYKYRMHDNNRSNSHEISEYDKKLNQYEDDDITHTIENIQDMIEKEYGENATLAEIKEDSEYHYNLLIASTYLRTKHNY